MRRYQTIICIDIRRNKESKRGKKCRNLCSQPLFKIQLLYQDMQKDEAEDEVEEEPDVDGLDVGGLRHDRLEEDVEGGEDGHAGDVCRYDRLKEFFPVNIHRRLVDNVHHHGRQICCDQQAVYSPL